MNNYSAPKSYVDSYEVKNPSKIRTILSLASLLLILQFLMFLVAPILARVFSSIKIGGVEASYELYDAIFSFLLLFMSYYAVIALSGIHTRFVIWSCALYFFVYWGVESEAFWSGLHPAYPAWYEISMATNDIVVASITTYLHNKRIKNRSGHRPPLDGTTR